jgi:periplasmic copper chaperone A
MNASRAWTVSTATLLLCAAPAFAHVSMTAKEGTPGSRYEGALIVPHGCAGSSTIKLRVRIPEGMVDVQVADMAGWQSEIVMGDYASAYTINDTTLTSGVVEITWTGGPLADGDRAEFAFSGYLVNTLQAHTSLYFPTIQECETGVERWIDIAHGGHHGNEDHGESADSPAPAIQLLPTP